MDLFRREALDFSARRVFSNVMLKVDRRMQVASALLLALSCAAAVSLALLEYGERIAATGMVEGVRQVAIAVPKAGVLSGVKVSENQHVRSGQVLFVLDHRRRVAAGQSDTELRAQGVGGLLQQNAIKRRQVVASHESRLRSLDAEERHLHSVRQAAESEATVVRRRASLQREQLLRLDVLRRRGLVSESEYQRQRDALLVLTQQLVRLGLNREQAAHASWEVGERRARLLHEHDERLINLVAEKIRYQERLDALAAEARSEMLAPHAGRVTFVEAREGEFVTPGRVLAHVVPTREPTRLVIGVPAHAAADISRGTQVRFTYLGEGVRTGVGEAVVRQVSLAPRMPENGSPWPVRFEPLYRAEAAIVRHPEGRHAPVGAGVSAFLLKQSKPMWLLIGSRLRTVFESL
ncbi:MAG: biotin/lipoyl-binding protein [Pseudomonadales bacterium]|jgi:multidrug resistance efflux pump|nr:biotin/lipoyl-binding protein [Pseudomonadales bacterium]MDP6470819.1 biotin/lipoyl-binding protein [Pseudomonadales bacterium]MDP6825996.1 biotin/lipoyl-binding protein [Pseudomonadales bacterium]MDP6972308.1 biotin/lipoyl-binding protein [Pseudomonadales bacterium]|tara:strand:- start:4876 stop:6096 length:1221 start_codon:yes stop_codon:yes gene_type:complete